MPRGIRNTPPTPPSVAPAPVAEPTPLIMLQPHGDGIQFNAYGLEIPEIVDALRLAIVHLVGKQAGLSASGCLWRLLQRLESCPVPTAGNQVSRPPSSDCRSSIRIMREDLADALDETEEQLS